MAKKAEDKKTTKKAAVKKTAVKKTTAKKTTASKAKATATKAKAVTKSKATAKSKSTAVKKAAPKKTAPKKAAAKKAPAKKVETKVQAASKPPKKVKKAKGYPKRDLDIFRKEIMEKREEIIEQLQNLKDQMMDPATGQYVNESSPYSLHMAEQGTDAQEREKLYLWAQRENKFLGYLEEALQRIENGTYGLCIECIDEPKNLCPTCPLIPKERLRAVPHTSACVQVKMNQKK